MDKNQIAASLDTSGKCCPMPMVDTNVAIKSLRTGEVLELIATDPATRNDIPSWCERTGNELLEMETESGGRRYRYLIRKTG